MLLKMRSTSSCRVHCITRQTRTEDGLQHFTPYNAASFVRIIMGVKESKLKSLAKSLFTAFSIRENSDALNYSSIVWNVLHVFHVYHNNWSCCTCCHPCMYVCMYGGLEALITQYTWAWTSVHEHLHNIILYSCILIPRTFLNIDTTNFWQLIPHIPEHEHHILLNIDTT
jgi:hypothetical protein